MSTTIETALSNSSLDAFGEIILGEYTGYEADFCIDTGAALPVETPYIPDEFVEWDMTPIGFQSSMSVILRGSDLYEKHFRCLHNVSIFGDHVDLEEDLRITSTAPGEGFFAFPDGSYTAGDPQIIVDRTSELQRWPRARLVLRDGERVTRVDVFFNAATAEFVKTLQVIQDEYSCTYCDGGDVEGSSGYVEGWANEAPMEAAALAGDWMTGGAPAEARKQLYLPNGLDVSIAKAGGAGCVVTVGWLVEAGRRNVLDRSYNADGKLVASERRVETNADLGFSAPEPVANSQTRAAQASGGSLRSLRLLREEAGGAPAASPVGETESFEAFGELIKGEYTGFEAKFDEDTGAALVIPQEDIPEDFFEWKLLPVGFQSSMSIIVRGSKLYEKLFRIMPDVSVFGDHVDFDEELSVFVATTEEGFYFFPDGSYTSGAARVSEGKDSASTQLTIRDGSRCTRVGVTVDIVSGEFSEPLHVIQDEYSCIYCDGADVEGSSGYVEGWASGTPMEVKALEGDWTRGGGAPEERKQLYLPSGIDVGIAKTGGGGFVVHVGWLVEVGRVEVGRRIVLSRSYSAKGEVTGSDRVEEYK